MSWLVSLVVCPTVERCSEYADHQLFPRASSLTCLEKTLRKAHLVCGCRGLSAKTGRSEGWNLRTNSDVAPIPLEKPGGWTSLFFRESPFPRARRGRQILPSAQCDHNLSTAFATAPRLEALTVIELHTVWSSLSRT
jgi:hypothetical protein